MSAATKHEQHLIDFRASSNGSRNNTLNEKALLSYGLAMGDGDLSMAKVEADYTSAGEALQMDIASIKGTLKSALSAAEPYTLKDNQDDSQPATPVNMALAPVYTALEDYAQKHGTPASAFTDAKWTEGEHKGRKCFFVPCEDGTTRARFIDGKTPKWMPIKTSDKKITPCWYGFGRAVAIAKADRYKTIVLCNGQPSVVTAQHYKVAALAQTDGEGKLITTPLLHRLLDAIKTHNLKIMVAYDGDAAGRKSTIKIAKQLADNGVKVKIVQFGGDDGYDLADYCAKHKTVIMQKLTRLSSFSDRLTTPVLSRKELATITHGMIVAPKEYVTAGEVLIAPFESFRTLGGFAYLYEPGKMTMVLAPSGGGKTSFMETWQDHWNRQGIDTMFFSPEWSPIALQHRSIQRYSGIQTKAIKLHLMWEKERQYGIPKGQRNGVNLVKGSNLYNKYLATNEMLSDWPGVSYAFQGQKATGEILEAMSKQLYLLRRDGRRVGMAFFDYAQLLRTVKEVNGRNSYEIICADIKDWCGDNGIHAMVGSQPTKAVGNASRKGDKILDEYDSQWVRPDAFNLVITLNVKEVEIIEEGVGTGKMSKEPFGICAIQKNNEGEEGQFTLKTNFSHLSWLDEQV